MAQLSLDSQLGRLNLCEERGAIVSIGWGGKPSSGLPSPLLLEGKRQLEAYFAGKLKRFDLPVAPAGPTFEQQVWQLMADIPFGETRTYGELAGRVAGDARDVAQACARNPLPILIPCHRVVAADSLGGYSGGKGVETKGRLLMLEGVLLI